MKKLFEKIDLETIFGGLFGIIAIVAIVAEMMISGFDALSVAGGIKDISGTLITVVMLIVAINALKPKKKRTGNFQETFDDEIKLILNKYAPMLTFYGAETSENLKGYYRYHIANKLDCVSTNNPGGNNKLFRIKEGDSAIEFSVSATVFAEDRASVSALVAAKIKDCHRDFVSDTKITQTGFTLILKNPLTTATDAKNIVNIIEHILILYLAEYKRK